MTRDAGPFGDWLDATRVAIRGHAGADVPCDGCTACCESGNFVHIDPDETDAKRHIPAELRFPAPGLPAGHQVMGHDEHGRCPMLVDRRCSIYEQRPRACRTYDCRIYAATGIEPDHQPDVAARVAEWRFRFPTERDAAAHDAVQQRAGELRREQPHPTGRAVAAVMTAESAADDGG